MSDEVPKVNLGAPVVPGAEELAVSFLLPAASGATAGPDDPEDELDAACGLGASQEAHLSKSLSFREKHVSHFHCPAFANMCLPQPPSPLVFVDGGSVFGGTGSAGLAGKENSARFTGLADEASPNLLMKLKGTVLSAGVASPAVFFDDGVEELLRFFFLELAGEKMYSTLFLSPCEEEP